jgi:hypothetical protein
LANKIKSQKSKVKNDWKVCKKENPKAKKEKILEGLKKSKLKGETINFLSLFPKLTIIIV